MSKQFFQNAVQDKLNVTRETLTEEEKTQFDDILSRIQELVSTYMNTEIKLDVELIAQEMEKMAQELYALIPNHLPAP